ncbi:nitrilase-related carbon-nitrogen hydrolase [Maribellus maritimus]|uniref:nitrilase-related carbon-nitrogen hydrolase n=1 Tax=Maribellus maritimus TaxID=2870838 RepID=UPI001EEA79AE|nr:nitrilase-related carbon-nitrogen hydrolase [Maribellus maritimus]MCG6189392.1 hypothetical protein [Maribellus maritimus]
MKSHKTINKIFLLLAGGVAITLAGINWTIGIAAWIAPVFLLMFTRKAKWMEMLLLFLTLVVSGMISQTGNNLFHLATVNIFNGVSFGLLTGIAYVTDKALYKKNSPFYTSLIFPSAVILVEYVMSFAIGTWGSIAHTQFEFKSLLQLSSVTGTFGISFLVVWFASVLNWLIENKNKRRKIYIAGLIYGGIFLLVVLFGLIRKTQYSPNKKTVKVAAVISDTDIHKIVENNEETIKTLANDYSAKLPSEFFSAPEKVNTLIDRTKEASNQGAKIIVWNEIAFVLNQAQKQNLLTEMKSFCLKEQVYVLIAFLEESVQSNQKPFNNKSILISPDGNVVWEYIKSYLHPYAETPIINNGNFEIPSIQTEYGKIGNVICADLDMPAYIKQTGKQNIDILLVPSFDWPGITPLHSEMACLEAIQFGFSLLRANGKGLTAAYDYMGNSIASLNTFHSNEKILCAEIPVQSVTTIYAKTGNILIVLSFAFILFMIAKKAFKKQRGKQAGI